MGVQSTSAPSSIGVVSSSALTLAGSPSVLHEKLHDLMVLISGLILVWLPLPLGLLCLVLHLAHLCWAIHNQPCSQLRLCQQPHLF